MLCLILTMAQVTSLFGAPTGSPPQASMLVTCSDPRAALEPRQLVDGDWALPADVLTNPAHVAALAPLGQLPQRDVGAGEWPVDLTDD